MADATASGRKTVVARLPDFPWDKLLPTRRRAAEHPDGPVDLAIGTPVDPTPAVVRDALAVATDWPGYPTVAGTPVSSRAANGNPVQIRNCPAAVNRNERRQTH